MSFWSKLAKGLAIGGAGLATALTAGGASPALAGTLGIGTGALSKIAPLLSIGGQAISAAGAGAAKNRGEKLSAQQTQDQINLGREASDRASRGDAWKQLQHADYTLGKGATGYSNPQGLPSFGIARTGDLSPEMRQGAEGMRAEVLKRLTGGSQLPPGADVNGLTKSSGWEKLASVLGPSASILGGMNDSHNQPTTLPELEQYKKPVVGGMVPGQTTPIPPYHPPDISMLGIHPNQDIFADQNGMQRIDSMLRGMRGNQ